MKTTPWEQFKEKVKMGVMYGMFKEMPSEMSDAFIRGNEDKYLDKLKDKFNKVNNAEIVDDFMDKFINSYSVCTAYSQTGTRINIDAVVRKLVKDLVKQINANNN